MHGNKWETWVIIYTSKYVHVYIEHINRLHFQFNVKMLHIFNWRAYRQNTAHIITSNTIFTNYFEI